MVSMEVRFFGRHPLRNLVLPLMDLHGVESVVVRGTDSVKTTTTMTTKPEQSAGT